MTVKGLYGWFIHYRAGFVKVAPPDTVSVVFSLPEATRFDTRQQAVEATIALNLPADQTRIIDATIPGPRTPDAEPPGEIKSREQIIADAKAKSAADAQELHAHRLKYGGRHELVPAPEGGNPPAGGFSVGPYGGAQSPLFKAPPSAGA
jgi:hypothetical protein